MSTFEYILRDPQGLYVTYVYTHRGSVSVGRTGDPDRAWRMSAYEANTFAGHHRDKGPFTMVPAPSRLPWAK